MKPLILKSLSLLLLSLLPLTSWALKADQYQLCYTSSDHVLYYSNDRYVVYQGDVHVKQGSTALTGDTMTLYLDESRQHITEMIIEGHPARYTSKSDKNEDILAEAETIRYFPKDAEALLLKEGKITQGPQTLQSEQIQYDLNTQTTLASKPRPGERTSVIINPPEPSNTESEP